MTGDARIFTQSTTMTMMVMIVLHLVIMAKARSRGLVRLQYPMT
jgi:hypothetical protein